ncbi:MAG TPA: hypothetical protein PKE27_11710 [Povalibacter sp.]|uniref:hypothetical protein n=1 Tax=Povalibacter sp. TaxID=1962978 RepID=UPI002CA2EF5A|nr:hypothetical protein [Povalibacter sp.]HMN45237.1 hypothetical protein [Povalibacter sp.]
MGGEDAVQDVALTLGTRMSLLQPVVIGTLVAGTLDISAAILMWLPRGVAPGRVLQSVAGGLLGRAAASGGAATAALGLFLHFAIMCAIVTVFVLASRRWPMLTPRALLPAVGCGVIYGIVVYLAMTYVVVPLSASPMRPPTVRQFLEGIAVHIACVGVPIVLIARAAAR